MKLVENTLKVEMELWEDPGDYPSNAGGYAQRSQWFGTASGSILVEFDDDDDPVKFEDQVSDFVESVVHVPRGSGIRYNLEELENSLIRITAEFE